MWSYDQERNCTYFLHFRLPRTADALDKEFDVSCDLVKQHLLGSTLSSVFVSRDGLLYERVGCTGRYENGVRAAYRKAGIELISEEEFLAKALEMGEISSLDRRIQDRNIRHV